MKATMGNVITMNNKILIEEHLHVYKSITQIEALCLYGISNITAYMTVLRRQNIKITSEKIEVKEVINRINRFFRFTPPKSFQLKNRYMTEYRIL